MKKIMPLAALVVLLFSCKSSADEQKFTVNGEINAPKDQKIYLEEWFFTQTPPEVLDTVEIKNGKFTVSAVASEESLYRLRNDAGDNAYLFINDGSNIKFTADIHNTDPVSYIFSGAANSSLRKFLLHTDSIRQLITSKDNLLTSLKNAGVSDSDSTYTALYNQFIRINDDFTAYCFTYADTSKSPIVALFAATMPAVEMTKLESPLANLTKRFPDHKGIAGALNYTKDLLSQRTQIQQQQPAAAIGSMAPEITMNDVNGKPMSLSQLRGKYVLVDFWASWCGPCRGENPNIVAAYDRFKEKNFTILGVSLDENRTEWLNAIAADNLSWPQISDLKKWSSPVVGSYGFDGIPYNVLVDPQGKIIASRLRGNALQMKLAEILK